MSSEHSARGRGTHLNPTNRFERLDVDEHFFASELGEQLEDERVSPRTQFFKDSTKNILAHNQSPDIGFDFSINPYRGCEHGCIYCYARPTHEYLGLSAGIDFETKIFVKTEAPSLLREALSKKSWQPQCIAISGVTDCYQPAEKKFELTRKCLEVLADFRNPTAIVTKNKLVTRDIDILSKLAEVNAVAVFVSVTSLSSELISKLEPRTSRPQARLEAVRQLSQAGIPVGILMAPVILGLTDHEMPAILEAAREAGASYAGYVPLRLPFGVKELFFDWVEKNYPEKHPKILSRIQSVRRGKLNDPNFGSRMSGEGVFAEQLKSLFHLLRKKFGYSESSPDLSAQAFRRPQELQLSLKL